MENEHPFLIEQHEKFNLSHGFLPARDPISTLPKHFSPWESCVHQLPKLFLSEAFRKDLLALPDFDTAQLKTEAEYERAMLMLSYLAHAYVWHDQPAERLPAKLSKPWVAVSKHIGRPPVLSYASYALYNWHRLNKALPIELGNIALLQNFLGGVDEEWFILVHVDIEAKAIPGLNAIFPAMQAAKKNDLELVVEHLDTVAKSLFLVCQTLDRMPENCDPYIYFNRVRPYIHGWKDNPALPNGLIYEGVSNTPQFFKGETGAQSSIIPCFDAFFGIQHADNFLKKHLDEMQNYMPTQHRKLLNTLQKQSGIRAFVLENKNHNQLKKSYNACIELISRFRKTHVSYAAHYIQKQSQTNAANPTSVGTGGTPFMQYLKDHFQETERYLI